MDVIEIARKRLSELELEAEKLRGFIATGTALAAKGTMEIGDKLDGESGGGQNRGGATRGDSPEKIVKAAIDAITKARRPLTRSAIVKALEEIGLVIGGTDKNKNLGTILWRSKKFRSYPGEGYWPLSKGEWGSGDEFL